MGCNKSILDKTITAAAMMDSVVAVVTDGTTAMHALECKGK